MCLLNTRPWCILQELRNYVNVQRFLHLIQLISTSKVKISRGLSFRTELVCKSDVVPELKGWSFSSVNLKSVNDIKTTTVCIEGKKSSKLTLDLRQSSDKKHSEQ